MNIISGLGSSAEIVIDALKEKAKGPGKADTLVLKDNQILEAKVLKILSETQAQLLIAGKKLTATTQMPLSENETLVLKVARSEGKQVLKRVDTESPPSPQRDGLNEMRRLGPEGPFGRISNLLNTRLPGELPAPDATGGTPSPQRFNQSGAASLETPGGGPEGFPRLSGPGIEKQIPAGKDLPQGFITTPRIPLETKLALLISVKPQGSAPDLEIPQSLSPRAPDGASLDTLTENLLKTLPDEEKAVARQFLDNRSLSWETKLARVLAATDTKALPAPLATLKTLLTDMIDPAMNPDTQAPMETTRLSPPSDPLSRTKADAAPNQGAPPSSLPITVKAPMDLVPKGNTPSPKAHPGLESELSLQPGATESPSMTGVGAKPVVSFSPEATEASIYGKPLVPEKSAGMPEIPVPGKPLVPETPAGLKETVISPSPPASTPDIPAEARQSETIRQALENLFTRLEKAVGKQAGVFDHESPQTLELVKKIKGLVGSFTLGAGEDISETTVKNLVRDSGLMWESKLKDLAAGVPEKNLAVTRDLADNLVETDVKALALKGSTLSEDVKHNVAESLKTFTESLEKMQILNSQSADDSGKYLLPLPYVHDGHVRFGQLFIDLERKKDDKKDNTDRIIRVAFLLDMSGLGPIQAGVSIFRKSIAGEFQVGNPEIKNLIDEGIPGIVSDLSAKGYSVKKLECRVTDPEILAGANLVEKLTDQEAGAVNIRI
jgi:hypothetical protein